MGLFSEITGFGEEGNPNPHNLNDDQFEDYYRAAIADIDNIKNGTSKMRGGLQDAIMAQLADLDNNAAGRKKHFLDDMSRGFGNNIQQRARAAGGTGTMASVMNPSSAMLDSESRARSRGLLDLQSQALNDLGAIGNLQGSLHQQDQNLGIAAANIRMNRLGQRSGIAAQNAENTFQSEQAGRQRRMNTLSGVSKIAGMAGLFGGGKS